MSLFSTEVFFLLAFVVLFLVSLIPLFTKTFRNNIPLKESTQFLIVSLGVLGTFFLFILLHKVVGTTGLGLFGATLLFTQTSAKFAALMTGLFLFGLPYFYKYSQSQTKQMPELYFLLLNALNFALLLIFSNHLILSFLCIEAMSLCLYLVIPLSIEGRFSKESAVKYFVIGSVASAFFGLGMAFLYGSLLQTVGPEGLFYLDTLSILSRELFVTSDLFKLGYVFVLLAFFFKIAVFPFSQWSPDVYQGAMTPVTVFMAGVIKIASLGAFMNFVGPGALATESSLLIVLQFVCIFTMLVGNFGALAQTEIKRMLAYSGIAHSGYILLALITYFVAGTASSMSALFTYLVFYGVLTLGSLGFVVLLEESRNQRFQTKDLKGLFYQRPFLASLMAIVFLSLAGIPPAFGFFSKFVIFNEAIKEGLYWLIFWGLLNSVVAVVYYFKPIIFAFFYKPNQSTVLSLDRVSSIGRLAFVVASIGALIGGVILTF